MRLKDVRVKLERPPNYSEIAEAFGDSFDRGTIYTYKDIIYCRIIPPKDLIKHESVHIEQQEAYGADNWWDKYIRDPRFRQNQEIEAYHRQYLWARDNDKAHKYLILHRSALDLSSSLYKLGINYEEARELIEKGTI